MFANTSRRILHVSLSLMIRLGLAVVSLIVSSVLGWMVLVGAHSAAHASAPLIRETALPSSTPWGVAFDNTGNVWVAEPGCDMAPVCSVSQIGSIAQYNRQSFTLVQNFTEPSNFSSPLFVVVDSGGHVWFTEPNTDAIGELTVTNGTPTWQQWTVTTANAEPYDLTIDHAGHIWFTEFGASKVGEFDPSLQQFSEAATPTASSSPYGISGPDPTTGSIWFTESNSAVARIGRFTPPLNGALNTANIAEYVTNVGSVNNDTPHLITFDGSGNVWWTEGFDANIGQLVISSAVNGTSNGVTEHLVPLPNCVIGPNCAVHISGIGVDSTNTVWFDDSLSSRIGSFVPSTNTFTIYPVGGGLTSNSHPHDGLAVDSNDNVWFTEEFANQLGEALRLTVPTGTPPVSKTWYFGEGNVGGQFQEYLTLDNPGATSCAVNIRYMYARNGGGTATSKTVAVNVAPTTRLTEDVDHDLGFSPTQSTSASVSSTVTVNSTATPNCTGIVAERPMYFHFNGVQSGGDALGATHTGSHFYFADVPTGGGYASFLTILNPGTTTATVTVNYYANGQNVKNQSLAVPGGTRGTINPNIIGLPQHVAAVLTSTQPVVVERPDYFSNVNGGTAGIVSGGTCVVGAQSLGNDWLFAEGATWAHLQEYLVIANLDPARTTANVTITLETGTGTNTSVTQSVGANSVVTWNVNAHTVPADISAEVTSTGANIVVERELFFTYTVSGVSTPAIGATDVIGQPGPAAQSAYSFAEGYTGPGFNEWLTIQNPTTSTEELYLTLMNGNGQTYAQWLTVGPKTRLTVNVTQLVAQYLSANRAVSMSVLSQGGAPFVAERPMYWSAGGVLPTRGGSAIIGYTGQ